MAKKQAIQERNVREAVLGISKQIDINFRNYALYVLEHRGIPSFYDALTNVQRVSLINAPKTYQKTISLVGACISNGYHHGDKSLSGAINKLARPFGCGEQLLLGDGFFGTPVNPEASAARYTSVKINPVINEVLNKYMVLNKKNDDDQWEWLRTEIPVGLLTTVVGIAVGYKSTVLPRKMDEIQKFLDGKKANMNPYFKGFTGKVSSYNGLKKTWLIEGVTEVDESAKTVRVIELPPLMKYDSFIKKLGKFSESNVDFSIQNDSSDNVDVTLRFKSGGTWEEFREKISKMLKIIVSETLVFVKDSSVIEYTDIMDYLTEYRVHREFVRLERSIYDLGVYNDELEFLKAKLEYLKFMLAKKRSESEIDTFLSVFVSKTKSRLERILLKDLSNEVLVKTSELIKEMTKTISDEQQKMKDLEDSLDKLKKETPVFSKSTKNTRSIDLFVNDEELEIDGIEVFTGSDSESEEETNDEEL
jgi:DNA gyrase/topoisomerase IV subunit A